MNETTNQTDAENLAVRMHRRLVMNRRVERLAQHISTLMPDDVSTVLDVGAGSGELAVAINRLRDTLDFHGVDVYIRPQTFIPVSAYDGNTLPFDDASFDLVCTVDVLHHCEDPAAVLKECARVSRRWVVIKDHIANGAVARSTLRFMDWVGNRAHGVVLPYNYLSSSGWQGALESAGLHTTRNIGSLGLYPFPFNLLFDRDLHFVSLFEKSADSGPQTQDPAPSNPADE